MDTGEGGRGWAARCLSRIGADPRLPAGSAVRPAILVCLATQRLYWGSGDGDLSVYPVSTAARGAGNRVDSEQTPVGLHRVAERIGLGASSGTRFVGRRAVFPEASSAGHPEDPITSRILWLEGLEPGINQGSGCDTHARYIYIHGTPVVQALGIRPASRGCIRMSDEDVIDLYARSPIHTPVLILERFSQNI